MNRTDHASRGGPRARPGWPALGAVLALSLLAACSDDRSELRTWMDSVRATTQPVREKIAEPKRFEPFRYVRAGEADPFAQTRLAGIVLEAMADAGRARGTLQPDTSRQREALESYPLDAIRMVGHLSNGQQNFALLQAESVVHQAKVGNHAGQNFGVITRVDESEVRLREVVQDAAGEWIQRETSLRLQEGIK